MSRAFPDYHEAYFHASTQANALKVAHYVERAKEFGREVFRVGMLPPVGHRYGFELRVEPVEVGAPIIPPPLKPSHSQPEED